MNVDLPAFGHADERGVGHQTQLEPQPALLAVLTLLREGRRPARVAEEAQVAAPAPAATGREPPVAVGDQVGEHGVGLVVAHGRALGDHHHEVVPARAVPLLSLAVRAGLGPPVRVVAEREERRDVAVGLEPHVAARPAVTAVGTALGRVRLLAERRAAGAAVAAANVQLRLVDEIHVSTARPLG